jgi:hypothetical protein
MDGRLRSVAKPEAPSSGQRYPGIRHRFRCPRESDGPQALLPAQYAALFRDLRRLAEVMGRTL